MTDERQVERWTYRLRSAAPIEWFGGSVVETQDGRAIAIVRRTPGCGDYDRHARLIATAPEMRNVLQRLADHWGKAKHRAERGGIPWKIDDLERDTCALLARSAILPTSSTDLPKGSQDGYS